MKKLRFDDPQLWRHDPDAYCIRFNAWRDGELIRCRVTRKALDYENARGTTDDNRLHVAQSKTDAILQVAEAKIQRGQFNAGGSIVVRSEDWHI